MYQLITGNYSATLQKHCPLAMTCIFHGVAHDGINGLPDKALLLALKGAIKSAV